MKAAPAVESYLEMLCREIPKLRHEAGADDGTCIETSRIAVELLRANGYRARPLPCQVMVHSRELTKRLAQGRDPANEGEDPKEWARAGAMMIVIGFTREDGRVVGEDKFDGHVIVIVEERYLLDLTLTQVRQAPRASEYVPVDDFWGPASRDFVKGKASLFALTDVGVSLIYHPRPDLLPDVVSSEAWRTRVRVRQTPKGDRLWIA